jgi:hypothetical protein
MTGYGIGISGFKTSSGILYLGEVITLDSESATIWISAKKYLTEVGMKTRLFIEAGPSITTIKATIKVPTVLEISPQSVEDEKFSIGIGIGIGVSHRINKSAVFLLNGCYSYVNVDGTFDPSAFTATIGVGFGG